MFFGVISLNLNRAVIYDPKTILYVNLINKNTKSNEKPEFDCYLFRNKIKLIKKIQDFERLLLNYVKTIFSVY